MSVYSRTLQQALGAAATAALAVLYAGPVQAQATFDRNNTYEAQRVEEQTRLGVQRQARLLSQQLFQRLCPGRCELVAVEVEMSEASAVGSVVPGFESIAPTSGYRSTPKSVQVTVLLDRKLPGSFKQNVPRMLEYRLKGLADTIGVRAELLNFPEPQLPPTPPPFAEDPLPPPYRPQAHSPPPWPDSADGSGRANPTEGAALILAALASWVGPLLMLTLALLGAWILLRRRNPQETGLVVKPTAQPTLTAATPQRVNWSDLQEEFAASRAVRNQLLREWLADDESAVAKLVRIMGASILEDVKKERRWQGAVARIAQQVARSPGLPHTADDGTDEASAIGHALRARLTAAQLTAGTDAMAREWEFLEGVSLTIFKRLLGRCDPKEVGFVLARSPTALRIAYLEGTSNDERHELMIGVGTATLNRGEAMDLAQRLRRVLHDSVEAAGQNGAEASLVVHMVESLPAQEQQAVLLELNRRQPQVAEGVLSRLVLDATCLHLPPEILLDALHRLPTEALVPYLSGIDDKLREHLLSIVTGNRRSTLEGELTLAGSPTRSEHLIARQRFSATLKSTLEHEGHDLYKVNLHALQVGMATSPEATT